MWSSAFNRVRARSPARETVNGGFARSLSPVRSFRIASKMMMGMAETLTPGKPRKMSSGFDDIQDLSTHSVHRLQDSSAHSPCLDALNEGDQKDSTLARTPSGLSPVSIVQKSSLQGATVPLQRVGRTSTRVGSHSSTQSGEESLRPSVQDSGACTCFVSVRLLQ